MLCSKNQGRCLKKFNKKIVLFLSHKVATKKEEKLNILTMKELFWGAISFSLLLFIYLKSPSKAFLLLFIFDSFYIFCPVYTLDVYKKSTSKLENIALSLEKLTLFSIILTPLFLVAHLVRCSR